MNVNDKLTLRQSEFLSLLIQEADYTPLQYYAELLEVSTKTLQKDMLEIEKYLETFNIKLNRKRGVGIYVNRDAFEDLTLMNILQNQENSERPISITNRRRNLLIKLLNETHEHTSIQQLSDLYFVSKSSIVNDLKSIESWLNAHNLVIERTIDGTKIIGSEKDIRKAIANSLNDFPLMIVPIKKNKIHSRLESITYQNLVEMFSSEAVAYFEDLISKVEILLSFNIAEPYYLNFLTHLLISIERIRDGNILQERTDHLNSEHNKTVEYMSDEIEKEFSIKLSDQERTYIHQYLLGSSMNQKMHNQNQIEISDACLDLVNNVSQITGYDFTKDNLLYESLEMHFRPLWNRLKYDIRIQNPLLESIECQYGPLLLACELSINTLQSHFDGYDINMNELAYICIYFQASIERDERGLNVLVVCHSGFGTSQLLMGKLMKAFPSWTIIKATSIGNLKKINNSEFDFIVSTVEINNAPKPYVLISALLSELEIERINTFVKKTSRNEDTEVEESIKATLFKSKLKYETMFKLAENRYLSYKVGQENTFTYHKKDLNIYLEVVGEKKYIKNIITKLYRQAINNNLDEIITN